MAEAGAEGAGEKLEVQPPADHTRPFVPVRFLVEGKRLPWHADKITAAKKALSLSGAWTKEAQNLLEHLLENPALRVDKALKALGLAQPNPPARAKKAQEEAARRAEEEGARKKEREEATQELKEAARELAASAEKADIVCQEAFKGAEWGRGQALRRGGIS